MNNYPPFVILPKANSYPNLWSKEQINIHFTKHHLGYASRINVPINSHEDLKERIFSDLNTRTTDNNNLQQVFNHNLMWLSLKDEKESQKNSRKYFEQYDLEQKIIEASVFGSGWLWIIIRNNQIAVTTTSNGDIPINAQAILANIDLWEHAYYIDYQWQRAKYIKNYIKHLNFNFIKKNYDIFFKK